jgi:hypothetical protein
MAAQPMMVAVIDRFVMMGTSWKVWNMRSVTAVSPVSFQIKGHEGCSLML